MTTTLEQAIAFHQQGDLHEAESIYLTLLAKDNDPNLHYLVGLLYSQKQQYHDAISHLELSIATNKNNADFYNALAICYQKQNKYKTALKLINIACQLAPQVPNFKNRKSKILLSYEHIEQAKSIILQCIKEHPNFFPAYQIYASICYKENRPDNNLRMLKRALKFIPNNPALIFSLAEAYQSVGYAEKSASLFRLIVNNNYKLMESYNNLGNIERDYGDISLARSYYIKSLSFDYTNPVVIWNLALLDLLEGKYESGWKNYDARLAVNHKPDQLSSVPYWRGEDIINKTIFILSEQGIGDEILFSSAFNHIIQISKHAIIMCDHRLKHCFSRTFPNAIIVTSLNNINFKDIDVKIHAGSIYQFFKKPPTSYGFLKPTNKNTNSNHNKIKVGFSWRGATNYKEMKKRSTHIREWERLLKHPHSDFFCLQHNISQQDKNRLINISPNIHFFSEVTDQNNIDELINLISSLDLVISVTNTVVHIAGALGVHTWCLAPRNPDWPWGIKGKKSVWYESVKIYRKNADSWEDTFSTIATDLNKLSANIFGSK